MPNGHGPKEYGKHKYASNVGKSDCEYGCGCWMASFQSGGPTGLDPFGTCPQNPKDGKLLGGNADYNHVVTERIENLSSRLYQTEERLKRVRPTKVKLAEELAVAEAKICDMDERFADLRRILGMP